MEYIYNNIKDIPVDIEYPDNFEEVITKDLYKPIIYDRFKKIAHCPKYGETFDYIDTIRKGDVISYKGERRTAMPHTCYPQISGKTYVWMFYKNETIYFVVAYASWVYNGEVVEEIHDYTKIYLEQIICVSREEQFMYVYERYCGGWSRHINKNIFIASINGPYNFIEPEQFEDTFLKYMDIRKNYPEYMMKEAALCAKYPQVEFIKKAGLEEIIRCKIQKWPVYIRPNWRAKTIPGFLGLTHQDVEKLKSWNMFDLSSIAIYKILSRHAKVKKNHITLVRNGFSLEKIYHQQEENYVRLATYFNKQREKRKASDTIRCMSIQREYDDYIRQLEELGYPLNDYYRYPKNLTEAHDRVSEEYLAMQDKKRQEENRKRQEKFETEYLPRLEKMCWQDSKYLIRPLRNKQEFDDEGRNNCNCVASYYTSATEGRVSIFVLRKVEAEEESFVTVEIDLKRGELKQCYGQGNRLPEKEVTEWVEKWLVKMIKKLRKANKATLKGAA